MISEPFLKSVHFADAGSTITTDQFNLKKAGGTRRRQCAKRDPEVTNSLKAAHKVTFDHQPLTIEAKSAVTHMIEDLENHSIMSGESAYRRRGKKLVEFRAAAGSFLADLLHGAKSKPANGWVSASVSPRAFKELLVSHRHFMDLWQGMRAQGWLEFHAGSQWVSKNSWEPDDPRPSVEPGILSRFRLTDAGLSYLAGHNIVPEAVQNHFRSGLPQKPIVLKEASVKRGGRKRRGKSMPLPNTPEVAQLIEEVTEINRFLSGFRRAMPESG